MKLTDALKTATRFTLTHAALLVASLCPVTGVVAVSQAAAALAGSTAAAVGLGLLGGIAGGVVGGAVGLLIGVPASIYRFSKSARAEKLSSAGPALEDTITAPASPALATATAQKDFAAAATGTAKRATPKQAPAAQKKGPSL